MLLYVPGTWKGAWHVRRTFFGFGPRA